MLRIWREELRQGVSNRYSFAIQQIAIRRREHSPSICSLSSESCYNHLPFTISVQIPQLQKSLYQSSLLMWDIHLYGASLKAQLVKNPPAKQETPVRFLGWEDPLEKGNATHSSILAWRILWTVESMGLQRVGHDWVTFTPICSFSMITAYFHQSIFEDYSLLSFLVSFFFFLM